MLCLWCDSPTGSEDKLCPECRAVNDHPPFHCTVPGHTVPTLGPRCAECEQIELAKVRRAEANAAQIEQLKAILNGHMADWHKPWAGIDFGKAIVGNAIVNAIRDLGGEVTIPQPGGQIYESAYDRQLRAEAILEERRKAKAQAP